MNRPFITRNGKPTRPVDLSEAAVKLDELRKQNPNENYGLTFINSNK